MKMNDSEFTRKWYLLITNTIEYQQQVKWQEQPHQTIQVMTMANFLANLTRMIAAFN